MRETCSCDIHVHLTPSEYLGLLRDAEQSDRPMSAQVRHLIRAHLALQASSTAAAIARDSTGPHRDLTGGHAT